MISTILAWLTKGPLDRILTSVDRSIDNETERQKIRAEATMAYITTEAETRQTAMRQPIFWYVWAFFAVPLGIWWSAVMLDTAFDFSFIVHDLPPSVRPWADQIFNNLFYAGGGVAGAQVIASAIRGRK